MRDHTHLPSHKVVEAAQAAALAIRTAYADRSAWQPSAEAVAADKQPVPAAAPTTAEAVDKFGGQYVEAVKAEADAEGWVAHDGKGIPPAIKGKKVQMLYGDGDRRVGEPWEYVGWSHDETRATAYRVIKYRVIATA
jgi:hypothetical protein